MSKLIAFLKGKKSYAIAIVGIIVGGLYAQGYIDQKQFETIAAILGGLGLMTARAAIKKVE